MKWMSFIFLFVSVSATAQVVETTGVGRSLSQAIENSYISAHFQCNRKRVWADLDKLEILSTDQYRFTIPGGKRKFTEYRVNVRTSCTSSYQKSPKVSE